MSDIMKNIDSFVKNKISTCNFMKKIIHRECNPQENSEGKKIYIYLLISSYYNNEINEIIKNIYNEYKKTSLFKQIFSKNKPKVLSDYDAIEKDIYNLKKEIYNYYKTNKPNVDSNSKDIFIDLKSNVIGDRETVIVADGAVNTFLVNLVIHIYPSIQNINNKILLLLDEINKYLENERSNREEPSSEEHLINNNDGELQKEEEYQNGGKRRRRQRKTRKQRRRRHQKSRKSRR